jgi:hypothetical protein
VFRLRFPPADIARWARSFTDPHAAVVDRLSTAARARGVLTRNEFLALCRWKTTRTQRRCATNTAARIREATQVALATDDERAKIYVLRTLAGVGWPTASVVLHFCDTRPYPVLDYRALWSLGYAKPPAYTFEFWWAYTDFTRALMKSTGYDMRTIDRALWQYSKHHQR